MDARSAFCGQGIQHSGSGNFSIAGGVNIASTPDRDYDLLLADLRVTDPRDDKTRIEATKGGLLEDSYRWILDHRDFLQWRDNSQSHMLWVKGDPGKGKTMLLCGIINELEKVSPAQPAYFFCQATDERLNSATAVLRGLLYIIVCQHPALITYLQEKYKHAGKRLFEDVNAWFAMSQVLTTMLSDPALRSMVVIIDALDECVTDLQRLLDFLSTTSSHAKWIVSSRNWPTIEQTLNSTTSKVSLCLELNADSIAAAVQAYIHHKVGELARLKQYDDPTRDAVQNHFMSNSNDTFLWVALAYHELADPKVRKWHTLSVLRTFPPGLEPLYERMMDYISSSKDAELCKKVLAVVSVVYRPVRTQELISFIPSPDRFDDDLKALEEIVACCGSFLTLRHGTVFFVHQSAKDFLLKQTSTRILPSNIAHQHHAIFLKSLEVLTSQLKRDIYSLRDPGVLIEEVSPPDPDPLAPLKYSCVYWVDHLRDSNLTESPGRRDMLDNNRVHDFLKTRLLHWLEALSLLRSISQGVIAMQNLEALVTSAGTSGLAELVQGAHRFSQSHGVIMEVAPLQVYLSALVFSPRYSIVRQVYEDEARAWITVMPDMEANWNACVQTLEGHDNWVTSVAFSADERRLASGSYDSTVKIWDTATGACIQTLEGHGDRISSVAFSADERRLASGSHDETIKIWDMATGACIQTFEGHHDAVSSVAFSANGRRLASGSHDETIKIWDIATGACIQTLEGHDNWVTSVAFSANGRRLASGSDDKTVKIWDTAMGACVQTLEGHGRPVWSVAFSADGRQLASGSYDKTVKIWDTATGACVQTLEGHGGPVESVAFSADGRQLASGSYDKTVKIWDTATGACVRTLEGHGDRVKSVTFSADGRRLASGSHDSTVKIWDTATGACAQTLEGHSQSVSSVAFSPDGLRLASGSYDSTVKIWDTATGACIQTLEAHGDRVKSVTFSADGRRLASGSHDSTVKIWDTATGQCIQTLEDYGYLVSSVVFSLDGRRLASGSYDNSVRIWDTATGACVQTLESHGRPVWSVVFSADDWQVVTNRGVLSLDSSAKEAPGPEGLTKERNYYAHPKLAACDTHKWRDCTIISYPLGKSEDVVF
ncbi:hypothetical protein ACHAQH_009034 [Verticillium albo-atrum]